MMFWESFWNIECKMNSSNLSMKDLQEQYLTYNNRGDSEPLKAMRIMERIKFLATEYQMVGPNRRNPE